ncbi:MAG: SIR2 family protein [Pyrinomonadaceae bacterium]
MIKKTSMENGKRVLIGKSNIRREYLNELKKAWRERRLVLFLGAGVSAPYGLANWTDLVLDLLLNESEKFEQFWPHYRKALALWMTDYFDFSPLALARVVKYKLRRSAESISDEQQRMEFRSLVRESLYRTFTENPTGTTALRTIAQIVAKSERARNGRRIQAILTANFDNVLEMELKKVGIRIRPVYDASRQTKSELRVIHVHGYLPREGEIPNIDLVFTEDEYHRLSYSAFHWALSDIVSYLRNSTVLFVGLSMSDPNLRRLLDATYLPGKRPAHFLLRKDYDLPDTARGKAIRIVDEYAEEQARRANLPIKTKSNVSRAINVMLKQAHQYDRELFKDMGLGTIWVNQFDDVPKILTEIASAR